MKHLDVPAPDETEARRTIEKIKDETLQTMDWAEHDFVRVEPGMPSSRAADDLDAGQAH